MARLFARAAVGLLGIALLAGAACAVYVQRSFPRLDGTLAAPGLHAPVTVERDAADVTHILAASERDAAYAIGFVHAQERGWQLEFNRRLLRGELSELLGEATLDTDRLLRTLGIVPAARRQLAGLSPHTRELLQAYADGVNAFHRSAGQAPAPEFLLLGARPGEWTPEDSVGWLLMMALDLGGNWGTEFARLSAAQVLDNERLWQLFPPYADEPPASATDLHRFYTGLDIYLHAGDKRALAEDPAQSIATPGDHLTAWSREFATDAGSDAGRGSNNWVVAGSHTASGRPLLANDPHLGLSAPAIWYMAHLQAPAGPDAQGRAQPPLDVIGATLPGVPFVVLGRTARAAWGFTNTAPDVQDLYIEQIDPADATRYRTPDGWAAFEVRSETIRVKGRPDVTIQVRGTRHGPVLSDAQPAHGRLIDTRRYVLALRWAALDADNRTADAAFAINRARSVPELLAAFAGYHSPMQNVVAADADGRIAYKAAGRVPVRRDDNDIRGVAPQPGWDARYDWQGWIPYAETPESDGAADGWIATANQRITPPGYRHYIGQDWHPPYRYDRIAELLKATPRHDMASMEAIQNDVRSNAALRLLPALRATASAHPLAPAVQRLLHSFDGRMAADSAAPLVFAAWADELTRGIVAPRLGVERFASLYGKRHFRGVLEYALEHPGDPWWCAPSDCAAQSSAALGRALDRLQADYGSDPARWRWGTAHPALSVHRPFGSVAALAGWFDVAVPSGGDGFTVNVGQYWPTGAGLPFASRHAASLRAVYDLADLERSVFVYPTGQSGLAFSDRYRDMADGWAQGRYRPLQRLPAQIAHSLRLMPDK
ncbi:penicillin acylase family protein [Xylophilus sp.]|uniref:penicillin acylase family protein n=1 Tax=Xylophilus sp. TaxID=2653893 RepID=UPI0013B6AC32|nr:penicillin acylase family protein [Xylophilus sp.]KAF1048694.1 MAG: Acyl-homoserine lactone acylase QuiP [Xylophilus sp.]